MSHWLVAILAPLQIHKPLLMHSPNSVHYCTPREVLLYSKYQHQSHLQIIPALPPNLAKIFSNTPKILDENIVIYLWQVLFAIQKRQFGNWHSTVEANQTITTQCPIPPPSTYIEYIHSEMYTMGTYGQNRDDRDNRFGAPYTSYWLHTKHFSIILGIFLEHN